MEEITHTLRDTPYKFEKNKIICGSFKTSTAYDGLSQTWLTRQFSQLIIAAMRTTEKEPFFLILTCIVSGAVTQNILSPQDDNDKQVISTFKSHQWQSQ